MGAQTNGLHRKLLICKESENHTFRFPGSHKKAMDGLFYDFTTIKYSTSFPCATHAACNLPA